MSDKQHIQGGQCSSLFFNSAVAHRRFFFTVIILLVFTMDVYGGDVDISIVKEDSGFKINATFSTPVQADKVREVLVDYENIPNFVSAIVKSKIKNRENGVILLEQVGLQKILPLVSIKISLLLRVEENNNRINFEDISKKDFERYIGYWEINEVSSDTVVTYTLFIVNPKFYVPKFIAKEVFLDKSKKMCREILDEINRRSGG